jgi:predicted 3-demethylubiquinone-9 3-methyltransferase (glyoxalase superfamily)
MSQSIHTFLLFQEGNAEEAINLYLSLFDDSSLTTLTKYAKGLDKEGQIQMAVFKIKGVEFMAIDSPVKHDFTFTPSVSLFVDCKNEKELSNAFSVLSKDGKILMDLGNYGFSEKFAWVNDKYGVSWQLNLKKDE